LLKKISVGTITEFCSGVGDGYGKGNFCNLENEMVRFEAYLNDFKYNRNIVFSLFLATEYEEKQNKSIE